MNVNGDTRWRRRLIGAALAPTLALALASTGRAEPANSASAGKLSVPAGVAGEGTWCSDDVISVPGAGSIGVAEPYPSTIDVEGAGNAATEVVVELLDVNHQAPSDLNVMLLGPTGQNLTLMSDIESFDPATGVDLTFRDDASGPIPWDSPLTTGTYLPTNPSDDYRWGPPAPVHSGATELAVFDGDDPNGTWSLFVRDIDDHDIGGIGGWCLTIVTDDVDDATSTALTSSANPSAPGENVTFTATVTSDGVSVADGTVTFSHEAITLAEVDVVDGTATFTTTDPIEAGRHLITARYSGAGEFAPSSRSIGQTVATGADGMWCSNQPLAVPGLGTDGPAAPYPSTVTVTGAGPTTTDVTVQLGDLNHQEPFDLGVMLVSPTGQSLVLMNDSGGFNTATGVGLTFTDDASNAIPVEDRLTTGSYLPTNYDDNEPWMRPAPPDSRATTLATFDGDDPNGSWSLFVVDRVVNDSGWIGGWCLTITTDDETEPTTTTLASSPNPSTHGQDVTFTATVTSGGDPVTDGTVTFSDATTHLAEVEVDAAGRASFTTTTNPLARGRHHITARFDGSGDRGSSSRTIVHDVSTLAGGMWCSNEPITTNDFGSAAPYPSRILVNDAGVFVTEVIVRLGDITHLDPDDLELLLVGPTGQNLVLMGDAGGADSVAGVDITLSDRAAGPLPENDDRRFVSGTYLPTDYFDEDDDLESWPAPAPPSSGATELATFNGTDPNGTWSLFVVDDEGAGSGWIGGWCLDISVDDRGPRAHPTVTPAPNAAGWHRSDVTVNWNWSDAGSGVDPAACTDHTTTNRQGRRTLTTSCRDRVGNQSSAARTVRVDTTAPTVSITAPTARRYVQGAVAPANYSCRDGMSGIASCRATVADGAGIDTFTPGRHRFTVTARDRAGNRHTTSVTYTVIVPPACAGRRATIVGTGGRDALTGTPGPDVIVAGGGNDSITGGGGNDAICAGAGNDTVFGGDGGDLLAGGAGGDTLFGLAGNDHLDGGSGADACHGGAGTDQAVACEATLGLPMTSRTHHHSRSTT
jgi:subtilisin-like proprotein convertase family protein